MNTKAIIGVVVVVVIVVAAVGVYALMSDDSDDDDSFTISCKLRVLGNANMDDYLNSSDVTYLQNIINGSIEWDKSTHPLADANNDGEITSADVELVQKFLNGQSATMYYYDWNNQVSKVTYPLTDVLGTSYGIYTDTPTGLEISTILGIEDKMMYLASGDVGPSDLDTTLYPMASSLKTVSAKSIDLQTLYSDGVRIMTGDIRFMGAVADSAESSGFTVIKLPENRVVNGITSIDTIVTLGAMFNLQDKTAPFITYIDKVQSKITDAVEKANVSSLTYIIPYTAPGYDVIYVDAHGSGNVIMSDVYTVELLPFESGVSTAAADGFDEVSADELVSYNPDAFIVSMYGYAMMSKYTYDQYVSEFKTFVAKGFDKSTAGANGRIYALPFEDTSLASYASVLVLAAKVWPNAFDEDEAWELMQEYFTSFTHFSGDVKTSKYAILCYSDV